MIVCESDLDALARKIKEFNAGVIDKHLDRHVDACLEEVKALAALRKPWWKLW